MTDESTINHPPIGQPAKSRSRKIGKRGAPHPADDLSFMAPKAKRGTGIDYWKVDEAGSYSLDYDHGAKMADEYLAYIGKHPTIANTTLLGCIVGDMFRREEVVKTGRLTGIELGFLRQVNTQALALACVINGPRFSDIEQRQKVQGVNS